MEGTLIIKARSAKLIRDTEFMGKMDPYCVIKVGNTTEKTKVKEDAGKTPVWEETFKIPAFVGDIVTFEVWDKETIKKDDIIGSGQLSISQLHVNNPNEFEQDIFYEKKKAGVVLFDIEFVPAPVKEVKPGDSPEEKKETDKEAVEKLQAELEKLWVVIEEEREKNKPVENRKKKDFSALKNSIAEVRSGIRQNKDDLAQYDQDLQETIDKFKLFLDKQKEAKKYLEGEHGELTTLSIIFLRKRNFKSNRNNYFEWSFTNKPDRWASQ